MTHYFSTWLAFYIGYINTRLNCMELLEEGQIKDSLASPEDYNDPAFGWHGEVETDLNAESGATSRSVVRDGSQRVLRLVVLRSSILPSKQRVAVIDSYHEAQLGRDVQPAGSMTPRVRLKEMEVSKLHATIYWDGARKEWNVVDMGSKHGTFLYSGTVSPDAEDTGTRLSQSKAASIPRRLRHADRLRVGSTMFLVHIHHDQRPCLDCTVSEAVEIPLFPSVKKDVQKRTREAAGLDSDDSGSSKQFAVERDPKKALAMLKRSMLNSHEGSRSFSSSPAVVSSSDYIDRAARRRMLYPSSRPDSPGVPSLASIIAATDASSKPSTPTPTPPPSKTLVSQPPVPLPSSNIGHRLLMQQGWTPGTALGLESDPSDSRTALIDPLELKANQNRAGLGSKAQ